MPDGNIDLQLGFDTSAADHALSDFAKKIVKTFDKVHLDPFSQLEEDIKKTESNIEEIKKQLADAAGKKVPIRFETDKETIRAQKEIIADLQSRVNETTEKLSGMYPGKAQEKMVAELEKLQTNLAVAKEELKELQGPQYKYVKAEDTAQVKELNNELEKQQNILSVLKQSLKEMKDAQDENNDSVDEGTEAVTRYSRSTKSSLLNMLKYAIGIRSLYTLFSRIKSAAKEGLGYITKVSPTMKRSVDMITNSFTMMKASLGAAIAPLVQVLAPVIAKIAQLFVMAANAVARFFAVLTGKKTVIQASTNQANFAKSVGKATKAVKDENKALKENLAAFDDINVLSQDTSDNLDDLSGGIGDGGFSAGFEEVALDENDFGILEKIAQILRDIWQIILDIWDALKPILEPIIKWLKEKLYEALDWIHEKLEKLHQWFVEHQGTPEATAMALGLVALALLIIGALALLKGHFDKTKSGADGAAKGVQLFLDVLGKAIIIASISLLIYTLSQFIDSLTGLIEAMNDAGWDAWDLACVMLAILIPLGLAIAALVAFIPVNAALKLTLIGIAIGLIADAIATILNAITDLIDRPLRTLMEFMDKIKTDTPEVKSKLIELKDVIDDLKKAVKELSDKVKEAHREITNKIRDLITVTEQNAERFKTAFEKMAQAVADAASAIASTPITPVVNTSSIDAGIAKLNTFLSLVAQAGSASVSVSTPSLGFKVPGLASGGVLPPNQPFLAMLGDQKKGTNVEAPLETITNAMIDALNRVNYNGGNQEVVLNIDGATFARLTVPHNLNELNRQGYKVSVLEGK